MSFLFEAINFFLSFHLMRFFKRFNYLKFAFLRHCIGIVNGMMKILLILNIHKTISQINLNSYLFWSLLGNTSQINAWTSTKKLILLQVQAFIKPILRRKIKTNSIPKNIKLIKIYTTNNLRIFFSVYLRIVNFK